MRNEFLLILDHFIYHETKTIHIYLYNFKRSVTEHWAGNSDNRVRFPDRKFYSSIETTQLVNVRIKYDLI